MKKTLAILVVLLAAVPSLRADEAEDKIVELAQLRGGSVQRDDKRPSHPVVGVKVRISILTKAERKFLYTLKNLKSLDAPSMTDADLKDLAALHETGEIESLWGSDNGRRDEGGG